MSEGNSVKSNGNFKSIVGLLILIILAAYFIFMFLSYTRRHRVSYYEVEEGSLVREHSYEGIILRNEKVNTSGSSGYINFYIADTRKASMNSRVYSIDETGDLKNFLSSHSEELGRFSSGRTQSFRKDVINASRTFDPVSFRSSGLLLDSLNASVLEFTDTEILEALSDEFKASGISFTDYRTDTTGIVSYNIDGYEGLDRIDLNAKSFDRTGYSRTRLHSGELTAEGAPVYKLITDEKWEIVFPMNAEDIGEFSDSNALKINFKDKNISAVADFSMFKGLDGNTYGSLGFNRYLIQFVSDRFVDFEIETNNVSGLKIPEKSITEKEFYLIPTEFKGTDPQDNTGFYKETLTEAGTGRVFIVSEIYCDDGENCYVRLPESGELSEGDFITAPDDPGKRYQIGPVGSLKGVYNINKGYAVFKRIEELERANGYCIIKKGSGYGLSLYDHIILDASGIEEGQVLY